MGIILKALFGLATTEEEAAIFRRHTGRNTPPTGPAREMWVVAGRRGGKSLIAAVIAVYIACFRRGHVPTDPCGWAVVVVLAADRDQAKVVLRYVAGLIDGAPMLARLVASRTAEAIHLTNRVSLEIHIRGRTVVAAICDELAFWRSEDSANPDTEVLTALRPAMATVRDPLPLCISSPYGRRGALWQAHQDHVAKDGDPILVRQASTLAMNPTLDPGEVPRLPAHGRAQPGAGRRLSVGRHEDDRP